MSAQLPSTDALARVLAANTPDSGVPHVVVALPSYSVGDSLLSHYIERIPALEHRYLVSLLVLHRIRDCHTVFVASKAPGDDVLAYYAGLGPRDPAEVLSRFEVLHVPDHGGRSVAAKLLDRPDLLEKLRRTVAGKPAVIEPWNVTESELAVARELGVPINGTDPSLRFLGFKSEGRRVFAAAGVPTPLGVEDVSTIAEVEEAIRTIRAARPDLASVIVKHDDSGAGDGNIVVDLTSPSWPKALEELPEWYVGDLAKGGVVEEMVAGSHFSSPSAQIDIAPGGEVLIVATHEQVMGGPRDQVYLGCSFPASKEYGRVIADHALATGHELARRGVLGRVAVDFAAAVTSDGSWTVRALEINLRKGGTTHPFATLRSLAPGRYDAQGARWLTDSGEERSYAASDNLVDPAWTGMPPSGLQTRDSTRSRASSSAVSSGSRSASSSAKRVAENTRDPGVASSTRTTPGHPA